MSTRRTRNETGKAVDYQYEAHASNISDMCLVITKKKVNHQMPSQEPILLENPYVFKPKSYSTKRNSNQDSNEKPLNSLPYKKVKKDRNEAKPQLPSTLLDIEQILKETSPQSVNYFSNDFYRKQKWQCQDETMEVENLGKQKERKRNPMMKSQITIISNQNEKIQTIIHEGLLLANTSHAKVGKEEHFLKGVINPFDYQKRNHFLKTIKFQKDYKSGYAPIEMQQKNVEQPEENQNMADSSKVHFIRKKQSTLSLPRSCGVSYIKPSESTQKFPFDPLPPLIFQCSSRCSDSKELKNKYENISNLFNQMSLNCWLPYIHSNQDQMRDLLLGKKVGSVGWVQGIQNLWPLFGEGMFFLVIYPTSPCLTVEDVWKSFGECPFKIGILVKKSTSGKKAFLKSLNIKQYKDEESKQEKIDDQKSLSQNMYSIDKAQTENNSTLRQFPQQEHKSSNALEDIIAQQLKDCRTVITLSLKLEMYVQQKQWKSMNKQTKDLYNHIITQLKDETEKGSLEIIRKRLLLSKSQERGDLVRDLVQKIRIPILKSEMMSEEKLKFSDVQMSQSQLFNLFSKNLNEDQKNSQKMFEITQKIDFQSIMKNKKSQSSWEKVLKMPLYYISTRDSFAFDLVQKITFHKRQNGMTFKKIQYFFEPDNCPTNYGKQYREKFPQFNVGITCYHDFFSNQELKQFEQNTFGTETNAFKSTNYFNQDKFLQMTVQPSIVGTKIKRTKFFFGYRYMWTRCQLAEPGSYIGAGVRRDVTARPKWTNKIIDSFVQNGLAEKNFINSIAINVYHDGKQGLAQHFDDAVRFRQPIFTVRLFSDARLSFGSQFYGFCNGAFIIPLPRGCICVMEESSYAANGVKHCVRPCDMTGKSAAVILRQMHHKVVEQSQKYDELIDLPAWISSLSSKEGAITFAEQKRRQAQHILNNPKEEQLVK